MIKKITDYKLIKKILFDDKELYDRISDDYTDLTKWKPESQIWYGRFLFDECVGLISCSEENSIVINIHINIPKKYRTNSFFCGVGLLDFLLADLDKRYRKINVKIATKHPDVIRYYEKLGFVVEGIDKMSYVKDDVVYDRMMMGYVIGGKIG
jgi:RimJ/RimL family protein N-acetyltransferase